MVHPQPRGRPRKGQIWDTNEGEWIDCDGSAQTITNKPIQKRRTKALNFRTIIAQPTSSSPPRQSPLSNSSQVISVHPKPKDDTNHREDYETFTKEELEENTRVNKEESDRLAAIAREQDMEKQREREEEVRRQEQVIRENAYRVQRFNESANHAHKIKEANSNLNVYYMDPNLNVYSCQDAPRPAKNKVEYVKRTRIVEKEITHMDDPIGLAEGEREIRQIKVTYYVPRKPLRLYA
jgi:hypothetical protein